MTKKLSMENFIIWLNGLLANSSVKNKVFFLQTGKTNLLLVMEIDEMATLSYWSYLPHFIIFSRNPDLYKT